MPEIDSKKNNRDDEIDLLDLFRRMGRTLNRWIKGLGRAFLISLVFILKRWLPLGLSLGAGIGVSYLLKSTAVSVYTSDIVLKNNMAVIEKLKMRDNTGTTADLISKINVLHSYCSGINYAALAQSLSMNTESVRNIFDISAYWIIDQGKDGIPDYVDYKNAQNAYDTVNIRMPDRVDIRVVAHLPKDLKLVRDGLIKYIDDDSLYQQRNRLRLKQNQDLLTRLNFDIIQLDSLQKVKYFEETRDIKPAASGQIVFMQEQKTQLIYPDIYYLYTKKQVIETEGDLYKGIVTVLSDFSLPARRDNGVSYYAKILVPCFFFLTLLVMIIMANMKRLKELFKKY